MFFFCVSCHLMGEAYENMQREKTYSLDCRGTGFPALPVNYE